MKFIPHLGQSARVLLAVICLLQLTVALRAGSITREVWLDISGSAVSQLTNDTRYPNQPSSTGTITTAFEAPTDFAENYGQRMHGYIVPPVTGNYTFWIASDDNGELWLSTNESPANRRRIAAVTGWTASRAWTTEAGQQSAPIALEANRSYYVAALQKEGGGGDNLAVRWLRPDGADEGPIPATYLLPANTAFTPPKILQQPANATVVEGQVATFTVQSDPLSPASVQWQRNGANIPGATSLTLSFFPATMADQGARFRAVLTNPLGSVTSDEATLTVTPDATRPTVVAILNLSTTTLRITFSEPVDAATALNPANYRVSNGINVTSAIFGENSAIIVLTTTTMTFGASYTITVNNVRDQASAANTILTDTTLSFTPYEYVPWEIGGATGGSTVTVPGGYDVTGLGNDIGGIADQFHFGFQERSGDFDVRVRVQNLSISHPYVQAGLMVRESTNSNSRFAGVFASSAELGCFVESRATNGVQSQLATVAGAFPANYPYTWLRLRRSGNLFTGFGSFDGVGWQQLASVTISMPAKLMFGMAIASHTTNVLATAQFRDLGTVVNPTAFTYTPKGEPIGPSTRRTGLIFSEIMYHPPDRADGRDLEFIEIYNAESIFVDLTGWRLTGAIDYTFTNGFKLEAGAFVVIAADPAAVENVYGIRGVLGPYTSHLNNAGDTLRLRNPAGALRLEMDYSPNAPWPVAADGAGHSLVLARPSYGENDPRSWAASERVGGSPGNVDAIVPHPWSSVVINEFLAHTDDPVFDFIELHNASNASVDISGCFLTDNATTNRFRIPNGTVLPARGFVSFDQNQLGFSLSADGETIYLIAADRSRVLDAVRFSGQENGVSSGRAPDGSPAIRRLATPTPSAANAPWRGEDIVINEIMYHPITKNEVDQFVELHNRSGAAVNLDGWRLASAIDFEFPNGAQIPPGGYVVVAKDAAHLRGNYPQLNAVNTFGDFSGNFRRSGDRLILTKPDDVVSTNQSGLLVTNKIHITISEVAFKDGGRWPELADGGGSSLELIDPHADTLRAASWAASDEKQKAPWTTAEFTGPLDNGHTGQAANRLQILMLGAGECLIDNVELLRGGTNLLTNGDFESGTSGWGFFGTHSATTVDASGAFAGSQGLHVRAVGDGDTGYNQARGTLNMSVGNNQTATYRAKVRWLAGWPEVLFRVRGGWIEMPVRMELPKNLGTPGQANSRRVSNAGPAIFDVTHSPALPRANQAVVVTARVSDPDGFAPPQVRFRVDTSTNAPIAVIMRDDGSGGDALAGDGLYSATIPSRASGLVAFYVSASDDAGASTTFPNNAPIRECLIRWNDTIPFGSFAHYHMWNTAAAEQARGSAYNNTYREATIVYGDFRVVYNAGYRDKGSPYHGGSGDYAATVPPDDLLLGTSDRIFGSTGNGGSEGTGMATDVAGWVGEQLGVPFLHSHFGRLYRNGSQFRDVILDLEQPTREYAEAWYGGGEEGDNLYKIALWFEFDDAFASPTSGPIGASLARFLSGGNYKLARYRFNWQLRPSGTNANDYTAIFDLATAANSATERITGLQNIADMEQWMRVFAYERIIGNWDSWTLNVQQNMYLYAPRGGRAALMPWDIDFVLGLGNGTSDVLTSSSDSTMSQLFNLPVYRRMLWRAYQDAANGFMLASKSDPQIDGRRAILQKNGFNLSNPSGLKSYLAGRRSYIIQQLNANDTATFAITNNAGADFTTASQITSISGTAPFAVATIEINGVPYPINWTGFTTWQINVPLAAAVNTLQVVGRDLRGQQVSGATDSIKVTYTGSLPQPQDWIVINEIMYNPAQPNAEFLELYNRHPSAIFDLSGFELSGLSFDFPAGTFIAPNGYLVLAENRSAFAAAYGANIPVAGEYSGRLDNNGETLRLIKPGSTNTADLLLDDVHYERDLPWPPAADGLGPSLQLIDPAQDTWRAGNWAATSASDPNRATPGRANATRATLPSFPPLWINEVLPSNQSGMRDNAGEREPWIEIYNGGSSTLDLSTYYLSDDYNNLAKWFFPVGVFLNPGQYLVVWADGESAESTIATPHTNFRLNSTNGAVVLSRFQLGAPAVMDYVNYAVTSADRGVGSFPDGEPRRRQPILIPTPGAPNNPSSPTVRVLINEWMASNRTAINDPADADFDDWFELYNAGTTNVDLSGFYVTDNLADTTKFRIPSGTIIPARSFRLIWADDESDQNVPARDLHVNFRLSAQGGQIGLYGPDGTLIDAVNFAAQLSDVSEGRFPDGAEPPFITFATASPGSANISQSANRPPTIDPIPDRTVNEGDSLAFRVVASDLDAGQALTFSLLNAPGGATINSTTGDFAWTPGEDHGPGTHSVTVNVADNGTPSRSTVRSFNVTVREVNETPLLLPVLDAVINEGAPFSVFVTATDADRPAQKLTFSLGPGAPSGTAIDPITGEFTWTPAEEHGPGAYNISVQVMDDGQPQFTSSRTFAVIVRELNNPPIITPVAPQAITEGVTLRVQIEARDPDSPPATLTYVLENSPAGASIDLNTGLFIWTPGEVDGPRDHNITIRVSEPGGLPNSTVSFFVGVNEANTAPVLDPIADVVARPSDFVAFTVRAADTDLPAQILNYASVTPLPLGASLDSATGNFTWQLPSDPPAGTNVITIRVTDDGTPPLLSERTFRIIVLAAPRVAINEIMHRPAAVNAEFVELANSSSANSVNLSGWRLEGYDFVFPANTLLGPGSYLCVAKNLAAFRAAYGNSPRALGDTTVTISQDGGLLRLIKPGSGGASDEVMDEVLFDLRGPWPAAGATQGASLQLIDSREDHWRVGNWAASIGSVTNAPIPVITMMNTWRLWQSTNAPGAGWNTAQFSDSTWLSGAALFYAEDAALPAAKSTALTLGPTAYYFRGRFNFSGNTDSALLRLTTIIDDGAVLYLNGQEIYRLGMPTGLVTQATFANRTAGDAVVEGPFEVPATGLRAGENVLAVEVHQVNATSSDVVFGTAVELLTTAAASFTPGAQNSVTADLPPFPSVWINEVLPNNSTGLADNAGDRDPWIELYNAGDQPLVLDNWSLTDDFQSLSKWIFPVGTVIPARGYLIVWADGESGESVFGVPHTSFRLAASRGSVALARLQNSVRAVVDYVNYSVSAANQSFGSYTDGVPFSRQLLGSPSPAASNQTASPPPPVLNVSLRPGNEIEFIWNTVAGLRYRLQFSLNLSSPAWATLQEFVGTGVPQSVRDTLRPNETQHYYRLVAE